MITELVNNEDIEIAEIAAKHPTTVSLAAWIRTLPQRDDDGDPEDGPKIDACAPPQRLRVPAPDPNCVERSALYLAVAEIIDPETDTPARDTRYTDRTSHVSTRERSARDPRSARASKLPGLRRRDDDVRSRHDRRT
ncbi:MAG: hypothetical protein QM831_31465 [Kofleriaceae bacterium]